jgi:hypothetical protein
MEVPVIPRIGEDVIIIRTPVEKTTKHRVTGVRYLLTSDAMLGAYVLVTEGEGDAPEPVEFVK